MKIKKFIASMFVLTLVFMQLSIPIGTAGITYDPCEVGDHDYVYQYSDISYYGGLRYFTVSSCSYASYSHSHFYVTGTEVLHYTCMNCGSTKTVAIEYIDYELGEQCSLRGNGGDSTFRLRE